MNNKSRYYIRVLAGAYLMYQGYNLIKAAMAERIAIIFPIFGVVFLGLGLAIGGSALVTLHRMSKEEQADGESAQMPETAEDEVIPEIAERQDGGENLTEPEELEEKEDFEKQTTEEEEEKGE